MGTSYLIEIRMFGKAKHEIRELILRTGKQFDIQISRPVPHITLVGGFITRDEDRLVKDFKAICCNVGLIGYIVDGIDVFNETGVVYLDVQPSKELIRFRRELRDGLRNYCTLSEWDFMEPFAFHSTIVAHLDHNKSRVIKRNIRHDRKYSHRMLRATLLKNGKILCEYDFLLNRMLSRREALSKQVLDKTMTTLSDRRTVRVEKKVNLWQRLLNIFGYGN